LDQRELFDREFLIEDSINMLNWKLHEETKTVLGHTVRKATAQRYSMRPQMTMTNGEMKREEIPDTAMITAWYATDIPVAAGPGEYQGQLPGLILELDINRGRTTYRAVEISPKVNLSGIKEPKGGKKMTQGEFAKERLKMMEEMQKNMPPGRTMQIRQ
jgi:GLPGLI family protein